LKDKNTSRYCHGFGITQGRDKILLEAIRSYLKITARVKVRTPPDKNVYYGLDSTNWRNLQFLRDICSGKLIGIKSLEFRIWERSMKYRSNSLKLAQIQDILRSIRKRNE